jgi:hypothetical protein
MELWVDVNLVTKLPVLQMTSLATPCSPHIRPPYKISGFRNEAIIIDEAILLYGGK